MSGPRDTFEADASANAPQTSQRKSLLRLFGPRSITRVAKEDEWTPYPTPHWSAPVEPTQLQAGGLFCSLITWREGWYIYSNKLVQLIKNCNLQKQNENVKKMEIEEN